MMKSQLIKVLFLLNVAFVSSKERPSSQPYLSGDTFRKHATYIFDETQRFDPLLVKKGDIIFLASGDGSDIKLFFEEYHPKIKDKYVLITHNGDFNPPGEFKNYLDDEKVFIWFTQNSDLMHHKKLIHIPIGLENRHWGRKFSEIISELVYKKISKQKKYLLYGNFSVSTNPGARQPVMDFFKDKSFCYFYPGQKNLYDYLTDVCASKFILSPHGNGLDCHRTWEALYLGAIPVVKTSTLDAMYKDLPVLIVNDWSQVTKEFLEKKYIEMSKKKYKKSKLYFKYWWDLVLYYQKKCRDA